MSSVSANLSQFCKQCGLACDREFCSQKCRQQSKTWELRLEFIRAYGRICQCPGCTETRPEFLSLDHKLGGGDKHRKSTGTRGYSMYRLLKAQGWPKDRYQLLCYNCNLSRAHFGKCPHEQKKMLTKLLRAHDLDAFLKRPETSGVREVKQVSTVDGGMYVVVYEQGNHCRRETDMSTLAQATQPLDESRYRRIDREPGLPREAANTLHPDDAGLRRSLPRIAPLWDPQSTSAPPKIVR